MQRSLRVGIPFTLLVALACASVPPATEPIAAAAKAIDEATQADAEPHARLELHLAREHLREARAAFDDDDNARARDLAEKALVEAELAEAKAEAARAERNVQEIREHIATLQREIDRTPEARR